MNYPKCTFSDSSKKPPRFKPNKQINDRLQDSKVTLQSISLLFPESDFYQLQIIAPFFNLFKNLPFEKMNYLLIQLQTQQQYKLNQLSLASQAISYPLQSGFGQNIANLTQFFTPSVEANFPLPVVENQELQTKINIFFQLFETLPVIKSNELLIQLQVEQFSKIEQLNIQRQMILPTPYTATHPIENHLVREMPESENSCTIKNFQQLLENLQNFIYQYINSYALNKSPQSKQPLSILRLTEIILATLLSYYLKAKGQTNTYNLNYMFQTLEMHYEINEVCLRKFSESFVYHLNANFGLDFNDLPCEMLKSLIDNLFIYNENNNINFICKCYADLLTVLDNQLSLKVTNILILYNQLKLEKAYSKNNPNLLHNHKNSAQLLLLRHYHDLNYITSPINEHTDLEKFYDTLLGILLEQNKFKIFKEFEETIKESLNSLCSSMFTTMNSNFSLIKIKTGKRKDDVLLVRTSPPIYKLLKTISQISNKSQLDTMEVNNHKTDFIFNLIFDSPITWVINKG